MSSYQIDRDEQIEAIVTAARRPCLPILPSLSAPGYSYLSPEGTRVGTIKATADEKRQEWERAEDVKAAEFRGYLTTASDSELARKVDYWLRGGKEQEHRFLRASRYIESIRNRAKRAYAHAYYQWLRDPQVSDPTDHRSFLAPGLGSLGAQSVRMRLDEILAPERATKDRRTER